MNAQTADTTGKPRYTLQQCIDYALVHQPLLRSTLIQQEIAKTTNSINLAGWLPQVNVTGNGLHYIKQSSDVVGSSTSVNQVSGSTTTGGTGTGTNTGTGTGGTTTGTGGTTTGGTTTGTGTTTGGTTTGSTSGSTNSTTSSRSGSSFANAFIPQVSVSQAIFTPNLLYAAHVAPLLVKEAQQVTDSTKIGIVSDVSKSFYNLLLTLEQINVLKEDTARLGKNVRDAYHQYKGGIVDETDYEEATITLNNSKAQLKQAQENVRPQYATLKQTMGYPPRNEFNVSFDTTAMIKGIGYDTTQQLQFEKRIEYQQLNTAKSLQHQLVDYYHHAYLPTVSAYFTYNYEFANNNFSNLFSTSYPSSIVGLTFSIPIFTGFARLHYLHRAHLQEQVLNENESFLKSQIYTEYTTALANYKGNLYNLNQLQQNVNLAKRVYFVVSLQYKQGIVAYLNVITAESNLITSQINYLNALFQLLSSKIDLQKATGSITY